MWWNRILEWFSNAKERNKLIEDFNNSSKRAFIMNVTPVYLKAETSRGNSRYRHQFSNFFYHGFRIRILSGLTLSFTEIKELGNIIITNSTLIRHLVALGYDTLEITDMEGNVIYDWQLTTLLALG